MTSIPRKPGKCRGWRRHQWDSAGIPAECRRCGATRNKPGRGTYQIPNLTTWSPGKVPNRYPTLGYLYPGEFESLMKRIGGEK